MIVAKNVALLRFNNCKQFEYFALKHVIMCYFTKRYRFTVDTFLLISTFIWCLIFTIKQVKKSK